MSKRSSISIHMFEYFINYLSYFNKNNTLKPKICIYYTDQQYLMLLKRKIVQKIV